MSKVNVFAVAVGDYPHKERYVRNLFEGFNRHLGRSFKMWVIADDPLVLYEEGGMLPASKWGAKIEQVKPTRNVWGWWNLMELYRPDAPWSDGHTIMVGLDTVIRGDVSWLVQEWPTYMRPVRESLGLRGAFDGTYADGAVCLPPDMHYTQVWEIYCKEIAEDETWTQKRSFPMHPYVTEVIQRKYSRAGQPQFWQEILPGKLCSYREPSRKIEEPSEPLVIFHGSPRPHEATIEAQWLKRYFK